MSNDFHQYWALMLEEFGYVREKSLYNASSEYIKGNIVVIIFSNAMCSIGFNERDKDTRIIIVNKINEKWFSLLNDFLIEFYEKTAHITSTSKPFLTIDGQNKERATIITYDNYCLSSNIQKRFRLKIVIDFKRMDYSIELIPSI